MPYPDSLFLVAESGRVPYIPDSLFLAAESGRVPYIPDSLFPVAEVGCQVALLLFPLVKSDMILDFLIDLYMDYWNSF